MIRQIMSRAAGCVNLGLGEPEFADPPLVREQARRVLEGGRIGYSPNAGVPELCRRIHEYHGGRDGHSVCVTNGSQEALFDVVFALAGPGDEVLVPNPGYVSYATAVRLAGAEPVPYPMRAGNGFQMDLEELEALVSPRTRALILNSPSNPTGRSLTLEQLRGAARLAEERDLVIVSDEIYRETYFGSPPPSAMDAAERRRRHLRALQGGRHDRVATGVGLRVPGHHRQGDGASPEHLHLCIHVDSKGGSDAVYVGRQERDRPDAAANGAEFPIYLPLARPADGTAIRSARRSLLRHGLHRGNGSRQPLGESGAAPGQGGHDSRCRLRLRGRRLPEAFVCLSARIAGTVGSGGSRRASNRIIQNRKQCR